MEDFSKSTRGASQVVSSMLLLLITVITFGFVWGYASNFINARRAEFFPTLKERLVIEDVWFHPNGTVILYVLNVGMVPLKIVEVHVNNVNAALSPSSLYLGRSEGGVLRVYFGGWTSGRTYSFVIVTEGGSYIEAVFTAP